MEEVLYSRNIITDILRYLTFSEMSKLSMVAKPINSAIKSVEMTFDAYSGKPRGRLTQHNFLKALNRKGAMGISMISNILLHHGTKRSIEYIIQRKKSIKLSDLIFVMMKKTDGVHPAIDSAITLEDLFLHTIREIFTSALFSRNKHYIRKFGEIIRDIVGSSIDMQRNAGNHYCDISRGHRFTRLTAKELEDICPLVPEEIRNELLCYSDLILSVDISEVSTGVRKNIIILNQSDHNISEIIRFAFPNYSKRFFISHADFTVSDSARNIFLREYKKNANIIHEITLAPDFRALMKAFPEIFNRENIVRGLRNNQNSVLFSRIFGSKIEWLYAEPAEFRGNLRCISSNYIFHITISCDMEEYIDRISNQTMIKYAQSYIAGITGINLRTVMQLLRYFDSNYPVELEKMKSLAKYTLNKIIDGCREYYRYISPDDFAKFADKYQIDICGFVRKYREKCIPFLDERQASRGYNFGMEVLKLCE